MILQGDLEAGFHSLRSTCHINHVVKGTATALADDIGQFLQRIGRKIVTIAMGDAIKLGFDCVVHFFIGVSEAVDRRAAGTIDILLAIHIVNIAALGPSYFGQVVR